MSHKEAISAEKWPPVFIDIEAEFNKFTENFRNGKRLVDIICNIPENVLNADYYFEEDAVVAELKCLVSDAEDTSLYASRIFKSAKHFGYSGSAIVGWIFRGDPIPDRVRQRIASMAKRPIIQAIEKANKQIRSTKLLLNKGDARGLALIANDKNFGFSHKEMISIICAAYRSMKDCHIDCIVYFSPNVYHANGDDIARTFWTPVYNLGSESFSDFVNDLGRAWIDHFEKTGDSFIERIEGDNIFEDFAHAYPISEFRKNGEVD